MTWVRRIKLRWAYFLMYAFFLVAGVFAYIYPTQVILNALQSSLTYVWASFLTVGGLLSFGGIIQDSLVGEAIGNPLLSSSNAIFGMALFFYGSSSASAAIGCIFCGVAFGLLPRWFEVLEFLRISKESPDPPEGENGVQ